MRGFVAVTLLLLGSAISQAADETACMASPTRLCLLGMAAEANAAAAGIVSRDSSNQDDMDRFIVVWSTWVDIIKSASEAGDVDFALTTASSVDKKFSGFDIGALLAALKVDGRQADLDTLLKRMGYDERVGDIYVGPALVAAGKDDEFEAFRASRQYDEYNIAAMQAAGHLLAGKTDRALAVVDTLQGEQRKVAGTNALSILQNTGHGALALPLLAYLDMKTGNGVAACAFVAQSTRDKAVAERCLAALQATPKEALGSDYRYGAFPQLIGALAAVGDWREAATILERQSGEDQALALERLVLFSHSRELLPVIRKIMGPGSADISSKKRGAYTVRLLVLSGQAPAAAEYVARGPDAVTRDEWSRWQSEALADSGNGTEALEIAGKIVDPVARARALCSAARHLKP